MTTPKPWTYYNDNKRCGIVLSVDVPETDDTNRSLAARVQLAQHGDNLYVSTGDTVVRPGEQAFVALADDMRRGWTNDADEPMVLSAGIFVEATEDLDATDGGHLVIVKLGGALFPEHAAERQTARIAAIAAQPVQRVHIDWTETPSLQSVESTQALAFMRYVALDRKLRDLDGESDAAGALRDEMHNLCWDAMTRETRELTAWAIADARSTPHEQTYAAARETQAPTEPEPRALVLRPLDEPSAAYWRAIQTTRDTMHEAIMQLTEARRLANTCDSLANIAWYGAREVIDGLVDLRKQLPDMPTTSAALDGGCANGGESGC